MRRSRVRIPKVLQGEPQIRHLTWGFWCSVTCGKASARRYKIACVSDAWATVLVLG